MSSSAAPKQRRWTKLIALTILAASLSAGVGIASGQDTGGTGAPAPPQLDDVECTQMCAGLRKAGEGSTVRLIGDNLGHVVTVAFKARDGRVRVDPDSTADTQVEATVPGGAVTGRVVVIDALGERAATPNKLQIVDQTELSDGGNFRLRQAEARPQKSFFFPRPKRRAKVSYVFGGSGTVDVRISVRNLNNGNVVRRWVERNQQPGTPYTAEWNGRRDNGTVAPNSRYRFRIGAVGGGRPESTADSRFGFYRHIFPVRGRPRGWGDGFGAGRGHQGQDIFVSCGTPLAAAQGGRVLYNQWQSAAGWYVVIRGRQTGRDYVYMHLQRKSPVSPGQTVRTGQRIGRVGATGNASGCHLHFEIWSKPGWYNGGSPMPAVTRIMRRWDSWS